MNAINPIDVTPSGMTTAPVQDSPLVTTPLVIEYAGVTGEASPVKQLYVPSGNPIACAAVGNTESNVVTRAIVSETLIVDEDVPDWNFIMPQALIYKPRARRIRQL